ncbi:hypothetical protein C1645_812271 [Glomus cerebriforme]|uniref:Uncharacterized protein n=1 Tax=Glomus cerebriforme TaxID=658196 RepID=A0A397TUH6_9GLOM|nr:hypothetical protein C1645_812271 [Glomus cerebriforme]
MDLCDAVSKVAEVKGTNQNDSLMNNVGKNDEPKNDESFTKERSSSSLMNQLPAVDNKQTSSEELTMEQISTFEQSKDNSRKIIDHVKVKRATKRVKVKWNKQELHALEEGMRQYGKSWTNIKNHYGNIGQALERRTQTQLKDKARSELVRRLREKIDLGAFEVMKNA